jgi:hypothetical protein
MQGTCAQQRAGTRPFKTGRCATHLPPSSATAATTNDPSAITTVSDARGHRDRSIARSLVSWSLSWWPRLAQRYLHAGESRFDRARKAMTQARRAADSGS